MSSLPKVHPHDVGLPEGAVRKRRRNRRQAKIMLAIALVTAAAGWFLFGTSIFNASHILDQPPSLAIVAYVLLFISSATLVLGFWYMLLAQMERVARMVDGTEMTPTTATLASCPKCQRRVDTGDHFCRHCGAALTAHP